MKTLSIRLSKILIIIALILGIIGSFHLLTGKMFLTEGEIRAMTATKIGGNPDLAKSMSADRTRARYGLIFLLGAFFFNILGTFIMNSRFDIDIPKKRKSGGNDGMEDDPRLKGEKAKQSIEVNFNKELGCAHHILNKGIGIMDYSGTISYDSEIIAHRLISALHTRAYTTFHSIIILCEEGFDRDALGMVRSLVEIWITILYILKGNPEERAIYYTCEEFRKEMQYVEATKKHVSEKRGEELAKRVKERMDELRPDYGKYLDNLKTINNPFYRVRISAMAEEVGMQKLYDIFFSYLSEFIHPTSIGLKSYTTGGGKKPFGVTPGRSNEKIIEALKYACKVYLDILNVWNDYCQLGKAEEIKKLEEKRDSVFLKDSREDKNH